MCGNNWPTQRQLFSWFIWEKLAQSPLEDYDDPSTIELWISEFTQVSLMEWHEHFYDQYSEFCYVFAEPDQFVARDYEPN